MNTQKKKIVFVCTGNTCRSPMAEILFKNYLKAIGLKGFSVCSAGIQAKRGDTINPKSAQALIENGLPAENFKSAKLTEKVVRDAFAIICMTERQKEYLMELRWNAFRKTGEQPADNNVYSFYDVAGYEVLDPYGRDLDCYRYVYGLISAACGTIVQKLNLSAYATTAKKRGRTKKGIDGKRRPSKDADVRKRTRK